MLDSPMQMHWYPKGPAVTVQIYVHADQITETVLYPHNEAGIGWQIVSDHPYPELETKLLRWFEAYCAGKKPGNHLPLNWVGVSSFTKKVLNAINEIPFGQVKSYRELAHIIEEPNGARAVGGACGRNPFPWIIPCHRVIASNGRLGGYSLDLLIKRHLLEFEGIHFH